MGSNLDRYKKDLAGLVERGQKLAAAFLFETSPDAIRRELGKTMDPADVERLIAEVPVFAEGYQAWYTEAKALVRQVLPDRLNDFVSHYEAPKGRKQLDGHTYRICDAVLGHAAQNGFGNIVAQPSNAIQHFDAQIGIVKAAEARFSSALFDIRQLVQADLFDSELDAARSLLDHGFARAAGAMCGVVLEHHLAEVCSAHQVAVTKKNPTIADLNEALKSAAVIDTAQWRHIQLLADIRNKCDHKKNVDPTVAEVTDLVDGVGKIIKTVH